MRMNDAMFADSRAYSNDIRAILKYRMVDIYFEGTSVSIEGNAN